MTMLAVGPWGVAFVCVVTGALLLFCLFCAVLRGPIHPKPKSVPLAAWEFSFSLIWLFFAVYGIVRFFGGGGA